MSSKSNSIYNRFGVKIDLLTLRLFYLSGVFNIISILLNFVPYMADWSGYFLTAGGVCLFVLAPLSLFISQYFLMKTER